MAENEKITEEEALRVELYMLRVSNIEKDFDAMKQRHQQAVETLKSYNLSLAEKYKLDLSKDGIVLDTREIKRAPKQQVVETPSLDEVPPDHLV